jgi:MFS family permease
MFLVGILFGFLPVYLYAIGHTPLQSGLLVSVATLSYLLVQPVAGWLADRVAVQVTVVIGLLLAGLGTIVVPFTSGVPLIVTIILAGLGIGTVWTNSDTLVSTLAADDQLGTSIGAAQSYKEFGDMIGPLVIGALTQFFGVRVGFVSCGVLALLFLAVLARTQPLKILQSKEAA